METINARTLEISVARFNALQAIENLLNFPALTAEQMRKEIADEMANYQKALEEITK